MLYRVIWLFCGAFSDTGVWLWLKCNVNLVKRIGCNDNAAGIQVEQGRCWIRVDRDGTERLRDKFGL